MSGRTFSLVEELSGLLKKIEDGRRQFSSDQAATDNFWAANELRERSRQRLNDFLLKSLPGSESARRQFDAERSEIEATLEAHNKEADRLWPVYTQSIEFIGLFAGELRLLLSRVPLTTEWELFRSVVSSLLVQVSCPEAWTDQPTNSSLETLEFRLKEMRDLANVLGGNIERLRKTCGWTYDQLAERTGLAKSLIIGHIKLGKGVHVSTMDIYAKTFSEKLGREITADDLMSVCWR